MAKSRVPPALGEMGEGSHPTGEPPKVTVEEEALSFTLVRKIINWGTGEREIEVSKGIGITVFDTQWALSKCLLSEWIDK